MKNSESTKRVFISHARNDYRIANSLALELKRRGFDVWDDEEISETKRWSTYIESALRNSDIMIALLTEHSYSSSYVRRELEYALFSENYKNRLLPVFIASSDDAEFSRIPWVLESLKHLRFSESTPTEVIVERIANELAALLRNRES